MDLESFYRDFRMNTFFLPKSVKKQLAASMPGAIALSQAARSRAGATIDAASIRGQYNKSIAQTGEKGALARRKLIEQGDLDLQVMKGQQGSDLLGKDYKLKDWIEHMGLGRQERFLRDNSSLLREGGGYQQGVATPDYSSAVDENLGVMRRADEEEKSLNLIDRDKKNKPVQFSLSDLYAEEDDKEGPLGYAMPH